MTDVKTKLFSHWPQVYSIFLKKLFQSGYGVMLENAKNRSKNCVFLATLENLNESSLLQITYNPQQDNIESDYHAIFNWKPCVTVFLV